MNFGGYQDVERAKRNPPTNVSREDWLNMINHFCDPKHVNRATKNAENRARARYPSLHGSQTLVAARYKKVNIS